MSSKAFLNKRDKQEILIWVIGYTVLAYLFRGLSWWAEYQNGLNGDPAMNGNTWLLVLAALGAILVVGAGLGAAFVFRGCRIIALLAFILACASMFIWDSCFSSPPFLFGYRTWLLHQKTPDQLFALAKNLHELYPEGKYIECLPGRGGSPPEARIDRNSENQPLPLLSEILSLQSMKVYSTIVQISPGKIEFTWGTHFIGAWGLRIYDSPPTAPEPYGFDDLPVTDRIILFINPS